MAKGPGGFVSGGNDPLNAPNAPTIDSVTVTDIAKVDVTFSAPVNVGEGSVDSYVITAKQGDGASSSTTASSAGTVSLNLTAGGTTTFAAQAISNAYGPGAFSGYSNSTTVFGGAELYATGQGKSGRLGLDSQIDRSSPVQVGALTDWSEVAAYNDFCVAVKTDGTLWAWGDNQFGQLGDGTTVDTSSPVQIGALTNWNQVTVGNDHSLAIKTDGTLWAWGAGGSGQRGDNAGGSVLSPIQVGALTNWKQVSSSGVYVLAVTTDGELYAWGNNGAGGLGDGTTVSTSSPVQVGALTNWNAVYAGGGSFGVTTDGELYAWGSNAESQLGLNNKTNKSSPTQVGALTNWDKIASGGRHTLAVKTDNTLWAWGEDAQGRLGDNNDDGFLGQTPRSSPIQIGALTDWAEVGASGGALGFSVAVKTDGTLWGWGFAADGAYGSGFNINKSSPIQIGALTDWVKVSAGDECSFALLGVTS